MITDTRVANLGSLRLFLPGQGRPRVTRRVRKWYSVAEQVWLRAQSVSLTSAGIPKLEYLPGVGIVNRAFVVPKDTRSSHFSTSGGSWAEERPGTGAPRVYRLTQYSTTADLQFSATWAYSFLANPSFAWSLILPDTPPDHDATTYPPYARLEFGGGLWAVQVGKQGQAYLLRKVSGSWLVDTELPAPYAGGYADVEEMWLIIRVHRGRIWVSSDGGKTYTGSNSSGVTVPAGSVVFRGQGGAMAFGLHQVQYVEGTITSGRRGTLGDYSALTPTITGAYSLPASTAIDFEDAGTAGYAAWTATLTPAAIAAGGPWDFYRAPELYSVSHKYSGAVSSIVTGAYSTPFDGAVLSASWNKPEELDQAKLTLTVHKDDSALLWSAGRYPLCAYYRGETDCDGAETWDPLPAFVGFLEPFDADLSGFNDAQISVTLQNVSIQLKRARWTPLDRHPLGGQTLNAAADEILDSEGIGTDYRSWHALGDSVTLPFGAPEDPFEFPRDGESKWETLVRIFGHFGLDLGCTDDGIIYSQPRDFLTGNQILLEVEPTAELRRAIERARLSFDSGEAYTAIVVTGELEDGSAGLAVAIDTEAENNPVSPRFNGLGRDTLLDEMQGSCTAGMMTARAQALAQESFVPPFRVDVPLHVTHHGISRRDVVYLSGLENIGVGEAEPWVVRSIRHEDRPLVADSKTTLGVQRL